MQYVRDLLQYCSNYVTKSQTTRIEEVLTFDRLRVEESIAAALNEYRVFDKTELSITTKQFLCRDVLYRLRNWRRYFDACIGEDLRWLRKLIVDRELLDTMSWVASPITSQIIRAEFRTMYFVHGNSSTYNYQIFRHMFTNGSELWAMDGPFVSLRQLNDEQDLFRYPLFTTKLPTNKLVIVKHVWSVINDISDRHCNESDDLINEPVKFLVTVYVTWAYTV